MVHTPVDPGFSGRQTIPLTDALLCVGSGPSRFSSHDGAGNVFTSVVHSSCRAVRGRLRARMAAKLASSGGGSRCEAARASDAGADPGRNGCGVNVSLAAAVTDATFFGVAGLGRCIGRTRDATSSREFGNGLS